MQETKYRDLVVLLILLDEVELRARELAEQYPGCARLGSLSPLRQAFVT